MNEKLDTVFEYLPTGFVREISGMLRGSRLEIREIRLRSAGLSTLLTDGGAFPLLSRIDADGIEKTVQKLCRGSVYAYSDGINSGYIPLARGIRVGVVGRASHDGERMVGVSRLSSLCFRIPCSPIGVADGLYSEWLSLGRESLLILAPPSGGKTTVLRSLASLIGRGQGLSRVVVIDERFEFDPLDYIGATVDILQGYRRGVGTEIAVRTMSPDVLLVDEICSAQDAEAIRTAVGVGIPLIATAHGTDMDSVCARGHLWGLVSDGCFSRFCRIEKRAGGFVISSPERIAI